MKKNKRPAIVTTGILTLITVIFWAGFEVYHSITTKPAPQVPTEIINPLDPTLDTKTLDKVQQRIFLNDSEIGNTQLATPSSAPSPTSSPIVSSTPSATPTATP